MKTYEEEVISIPAAKGIDGVSKYGVYACPLKKRFNYKQSLYLAFREKGGLMYKLYKLRNRYEILPNIDNISYRSMDNTDRKSILAFMKDKAIWVEQDASTTCQFFVLDTKHTITLPTGGASSGGRSPQGIVYYYLSDMLDVKKCKNLKPCSQC